MTDTGLPPDLPGEALPNFGAQSPVPPPVTQPPVAQPPLPPAYAYPVAPPTGMSTGAKAGLIAGLGCLGLIVIVVIIVAVGIVGASLSSSDENYEPTWPTDIDDDSDDDSGNTVGATEAQWKSGADWLAAPADEPAPGAFLPGYSTPEEYLQYAMGASFDFEVVFTDDPDLNCGFDKATPAPDWVIGCYNPAYGRTIFLWWGPDAVDDMKALILLHEYSHYWQNYEYFDATQSAVDAGLFDDPDFIQNVWETDATCRVYDDWHYTDLRYLDSYTVSPCGDTGWGEHWFENALLERGVLITDY